ncbi:4'-phosphopantetheinyl transferase family protein [Sodalinema gerasimenkoae]|uniref:4'-phosphopantetheinyl transferase family protein n=1 Tax=Sodalinema gerasimenkoae TaxID=2862348 RepID=UPI001357471C|nr:4'-phosphopantetheinyl transferase superfamily protein [Sodalinema gerasimenkoae]
MSDGSAVCWPQWPVLPTLVADQVWVWRLSLNGTQDLDSMWECLSSAERERADRYRRPGDRQGFILTRSWLRRLAGAYLGLAPEALQFQVSPHGKPFLAGSPLRFNLSHSGDWALLAFSGDRPLGIDLEVHRSVPVLALAKRFFQGSEWARLQELSGDWQRQVFFDYWTAKEAYLKATGEGLGALSKVEIAEAGDRLSLWRRSSDSTVTGEPLRWQTFEAQRLCLGPGYSAALVVGPKGNELFFEDSLDTNVTKVNNKSAGIRICQGTISPKMRVPS